MCIPCFPVKPPHIIGDLPSHRLFQIKSFAKAGVNFAGPFKVKAAILRKVRVTIAYICIFIFMVTTTIPSSLYLICPLYYS